MSIANYAARVAVLRRRYPLAVAVFTLLCCAIYYPRTDPDGFGLILVFGAFLLDPDRMPARFGLGLAVAVLVDAFVIRCLALEPSSR